MAAITPVKGFVVGTDAMALDTGFDVGTEAIAPVKGFVVGTDAMALDTGFDVGTEAIVPVKGFVVGTVILPALKAEGAVGVGETSAEGVS